MQVTRLAFHAHPRDLRTAGAEIVDDFTVSAFERFPRPPQTRPRARPIGKTILPIKARRFP